MTSYINYGADQRYRLRRGRILKLQLHHNRITRRAARKKHRPCKLHKAIGLHLPDRARQLFWRLGVRSKIAVKVA